MQDWFKDESRAADLIEGWRKACELARCAWGGGETPTLNGVVERATVVLAGIGDRPHQAERSPHQAERQAGDADYHLRKLWDSRQRPHARAGSGRTRAQWFCTPLRDGRPYGDALLDPTHIYVGAVEDCLDRGVFIAVNVTGHGSRKLMRARESFRVLFVDTVPVPQPVFEFIQSVGNVDDAEAYGNLNMGAGFAGVPARERCADGSRRGYEQAVRRAARGTHRNESRQEHADRPQRPRILQRHPRRQVKGVRPPFLRFS